MCLAINLLTIWYVQGRLNYIMLFIIVLFYYVGFLVGIRPFNNDIPKTELRQVTPEDKTPQTHIISIHPTMNTAFDGIHHIKGCLLYTSPSPRD